VAASLGCWILPPVADDRGQTDDNLGIAHPDIRGRGSARLRVRHPTRLDACGDRRNAALFRTGRIGLVLVSAGIPMASLALLTIGFLLLTVFDRRAGLAGNAPAHFAPATMANGNCGGSARGAADSPDVGAIKLRRVLARHGRCFRRGFISQP
jgi:hypothetical protein